MTSVIIWLAVLAFVYLLIGIGEGEPKATLKVPTSLTLYVYHQESNHEEVH